MMPLGHLGLPLVPFIFSKARRTPPWPIFLGALIPDIIDKPVGHLLLPENNGRIFAHTLLFAGLVLTIALAYKPLMPLSFGVSAHHLLDGMFLEPRTAIWPLLGPFEATDFVLMDWAEVLLRPFTIAEEAAGAFALLWFVAFVYLSVLTRPWRARSRPVNGAEE